MSKRVVQRATVPMPLLPCPPERGLCLPNVWAPVAILIAVAGATLVMISWGQSATTAVSTTSAIGLVATLAARRARLRDAWASVATLVVVAVSTLLLIHWDQQPTAAVSTTSSIGVLAIVVTRGMLRRPAPATKRQNGNAAHGST